MFRRVGAEGGRGVWSERVFLFHIWLWVKVGQIVVRNRIIPVSVDIGIVSIPWDRNFMPPIFHVLNEEVAVLDFKQAPTSSVQRVGSVV